MTERRRERDCGECFQGRVDLTELDAEPADLDLEIGATDVLDREILRPPDDVSGAIHATTGGPVRIRDEALRCQLLALVVAASDGFARQIELTCDTCGDGLQARIQNEGTDAGNGRADRDRLAHEQLGSGGDDRCLGRPVRVEEASTTGPA